MRKGRLVALAVISFAVILLTAFALSQRGAYGWTLFITLPLIAGGLGTCIFRPATAGKAAAIGAAIGAVGCALFLVLGWEGIICVLTALPLIVPLTAIGSLIVYWGSASPRSEQSGSLACLLPLTLFFDVTAQPPVYSVTTSIVVKAQPERVWKNIVAFPYITDEPDWVLRTGVAYPIQTRIEGSGVGAPRHCDLSTGSVQERVVTWDEPRVLRFVVTATPLAMRETGLYGPIHPKHLTGYYIAKEGQFELTPLPGHQTLLVGTSWYQHGLWPAAYWRIFSDTVVHHVHRRVLEHIRTLSEENRID